MPIPVTCPGCLKRFSVADKFAGKQGPCPNCKKTITIPKLEEQVVIHAPDHSESGAIGAGGRHVLKTYKRSDTKFQPLIFTAVIGAVLVALLIALVMRTGKTPPDAWLLAVAAVVLGPLLAWAGYTFLRDAELEAYTGPPLIIRSLACGLVYALLWEIFVFLGGRFFGPDAMKAGLEIWQMVVLILPVLAAGTLAGFASFDLDPGSAFFHCAMYFAVTVLLRLVAGLPAVPGLGATQEFGNCNLIFHSRGDAVSRSSIHDIPEVGRSRSATGRIRIPPGVDVPLTPRVRRLIDSASFRRLAQISQLGLVRFVYPAATHTRQEHSLGVFLAAIEYLDQLAGDERFAAAIAPSDGELLLAAALLHDIGHWPFGHPIEDLGLPEITSHESLAGREITSGELAEILRNDWNLEPADVADLVCGSVQDRSRRLLRSILSGPIDVDKIDYLMRDSLHAGVPYGQHFDRRRLIGSLCLNEAGDALAITDKGKTAAEMMVFARYVMFSEVYWHHAVRSATAMLQRAFYTLRSSLDVGRLVTLTEQPMIDSLLAAGRASPAGALLDGLFGPQRQLYKRLGQYSYFEEPELYQQMARRPYAELVGFAERITAMLSKAIGANVAPHEVLVDAPPAELEVDFDIEVHFAKQGVYRRLGEISPFVRTLAQEQFDNYVKRVRIFVHPRVAEAVRKLPDLAERLADTIGSA